MIRKAVSTAVGFIVGLTLGYVLYILLKAFFGSTWSLAEGGPWLVIYSPYLVLASVGTVIGFFTKIKKAISACLVTFFAFLIGGLALMVVAGMFIGGGAIYVVAVIGYVAGGICTFSAILKNS